jgi:hypothetical protein
VALAPQKFAAWLSAHVHRDGLGHTYHYHPRSDAHSIALCTLLWEDFLTACPLLRSQAESGVVICAINVKFTWPTSGKSKTLDLAIGPPVGAPAQPGLAPIIKAQLAEVFLSCEAKSVMTEHGKSQPRVFDELSSAHEIVHQGSQKALATGITVVNICSTFIFPLRQKVRRRTHVSPHKQPEAARAMVEHLRGLPIRDAEGQVGFDAYATVVLSCSNRADEPVTLWTDPPAPQSGDPDHYETLLERVSGFYSERFG